MACERAERLGVARPAADQDQRRGGALQALAPSSANHQARREPDENAWRLCSGLAAA
jgi:hypothetical protein